MDELKPCPFCGPGESQVGLWFDDVALRYRVGCGRCGCSTGIHPRDKTEAPAIAAWNRRPADVDASQPQQGAGDAFDAGWRMAAAWAYRDDLLADMDSSAYKTERGAALAAHGKPNA